MSGNRKNRVLILGGGFGGLKAAQDLADDRRFKVTLVSDQDYFRYYPALYHSATGGSSKVSAIPMDELIGGHNIDFIKARATGLDRTHQQVVTKGAGRLDYDTLIVALGMNTSFFGIKGLEEHAYGIKSIDEVLAFKKHLHQQLTKGHSPDHNYVVVGGGPTGVELSGMLPSYLKFILRQHGIKHKAVKVELVEAAPRILPHSSKNVSRKTARRLRQLGVTVKTGQKVEALSADTLIVNGQPLKSRTVVWTAGVACSPFLQDNKFALTPSHRAAVNQYLQAEPNIYVIGDNADTKYGGVAQTALYDALFVTKNLKRLVSGKKAKSYKPKRPIYVIPTGPKWASVVWGPVHLFGRVGWWLRQAADLIAYHDYQPWWPAGRRWLAFNDTEESCALCATEAPQGSKI